MKISYGWLKRYLDFNKTPAEVAETVTRLGLEVEEIQTLGVAPNQLLVVGEVLSRDKHPNADKLSVCKVDVGGETPLQIVCGANNFAPGDRVPVALVGCKLPDGDNFFEIKAAKLRGVESFGMMCATDEIGLGGNHEGLMILSDRPRIGMPLHQVLGSDTIFEIKATPNRPDALSHLGIARDLSAAWGLSLKTVPATVVAETRAITGFKGVSVENSSDCPHYRAYVIRDVKIAPSPAWLQTLIKAIGMRPISNVVDITNFILYSLGQPLHAFDLEKIAGAELKVRRARDKEKLVTLDGKERTLDPTMLVIADAQKPLVVAGIMGGVDAEVGPATTDILLEAAQFNPTLIRKTGRKLALSSDSSYRYERGIDPLGLQGAAERAVAMILEIAGGKLAEGVIVAGKPPYEAKKLPVSREFIVRQLGFEVSGAEIEKALTAFGFALTKKGEGAWEVLVPSFRLDILRPVDLVEEVLRFYGVDRIPSSPLIVPANESADDGLYTAVREISRRLIALGYSECLHYTLRGKPEAERLNGAEAAVLLKVENPLSAEMSYLRTSLIPGLIEALSLNRSRGNTLLPLFETGRVFRPREGNLHELQSIAFVKVISPAEVGWKKREASDFFEAKAIVENLLCSVGMDVAKGSWIRLDSNALWQPLHSAVLSLGEQVANAGIVNLQVLKAADFSGIVLAGEIILTLNALDKGATMARYTPISLFPNTRRDVALIVPQSISAGEVQAKVAQLASLEVAGKFQLEEIRLFDLYEGQGIPAGHKSLAYALIFRSANRTLTDSEVNGVFNALIAKLKESGLQLRG